MESLFFLHDVNEYGCHIQQTRERYSCMNEMEVLRRKLNNHVSLDLNNLTSEDTLEISRELDEMMLKMCTAYGEYISAGN